MSEQSPNSHLEPPQKSVELQDSGAQESVPHSDDEDHFSDASEGRHGSHSRTTSGYASPIPRTRVEKVDENPAHGEVPGTAAYGKRGKDSVPDEIEVIPEGSRSRSQSIAENCPQEDASVPRTMVEKVEPERPSHGDIPGTFAYEQRKADAVPDLVTTAPESGGASSEQSPGTRDDGGNGGAGSTAVPETLVSQVESGPRESPGPYAHRRRPSDALPDSTEIVPDAPDPQSSLGPSPEQFKEKMHGSNDVDHDFDEPTTSIPGALPEEPDPEPPGMDDFDDFAEERADMGDDDFGDFDDGFQEPAEEAEVEDMNEGVRSLQPQQSMTLPSVPPLLDLDSTITLPDVCTALESPLDRLFPTTKETPSLPPVPPIQNDSAIFHTDRSLSLWSQLVAPPPLQPQNWVKSRIRRLFLVSLGVPVDLDEILPASKQKKLVLPQTTDSSSTQPGKAAAGTGADGTSTTTKTPDHQHQHNQQNNRQSYLRRREAPPPDLDFNAMRRLCATTDAALDGYTDSELKAHVDELQSVTKTASAALEYWVKKYDGLIGEKEAFEGVIENLVSHARRVRK